MKADQREEAQFVPLEDEEERDVTYTKEMIWEYVCILLSWCRFCWRRVFWYDDSPRSNTTLLSRNGGRSEGRDATCAIGTRGRKRLTYTKEVIWEHVYIFFCLCCRFWEGVLVCMLGVLGDCLCHWKMSKGFHTKEVIWERFVLACLFSCCLVFFCLSKIGALCCSNTT